MGQAGGREPGDRRGDTDEGCGGARAVASPKGVLVYNGLDICGGECSLYSRLFSTRRSGQGQETNTRKGEEGGMKMHDERSDAIAVI